MLRHIPSLKMLRGYFGRQFDHDYGDLSGEKLRELRQRLEAWRDGLMKSREMLDEANRLLGGHGVEYIRTEEDDQHAAHGAYYVNMGDTYTATLLLDLDRGRMWATTWGDWVESEQRQGKRIV